MAKPQKHTEIECKIDVSIEDIQRAFEALKPKDKSKISVKSHPRDYHDTKDLDLKSGKRSLRMEHCKGGIYRMTLKKSEGSQGGHKVVSEWEFDLKTPKPDFNEVTDKEAQAALSDIDPSDLRHVYTTNVPAPKFIMDVKTKDGKKGQVEISFDVGEIYLSSKYQIKFNCFARIPVCEIEVEYVSGDASCIDTVVKQIYDMCPSAAPGKSGKGSRGAKLYTEARDAYKAGKMIKPSKK